MRDVRATSLDRQNDLLRLASNAFVMEVKPSVDALVLPECNDNVAET
jgi:hypothetical protein